jgi:hypothetical protein
VQDTLRVMLRVAQFHKFKWLEQAVRDMSVWAMIGILSCASELVSERWEERDRRLEEKVFLFVYVRYRVNLCCSYYI